MIKPTDYYLPGGRSGVLLIHGLTGTPTEMRFVATHFVSQMRRFAQALNALLAQTPPRLGTEDWADRLSLLKTGWRDWYRSVGEAADRLRKDVDHMFVAGLSMGALLALKLAADRPAEVDGLGLYGTTFVYDGWTIPWIGKLSFLLPLVVRLGFGHRQRFHECFPYGIKDERIRQRIAPGSAPVHCRYPIRWLRCRRPGQ